MANAWLKWAIFVSVVSALYLLSTDWTKEQFYQAHIHKLPLPYADQEIVEIALARMVMNPIMENFYSWPLRNVNTLNRVPKHYQPYLKILSAIQSKHVHALKTVPTYFRAEKPFTHSAENLKNAGYACPCKNLVTVNEGGRLGNKMSQYMTLLVHSMRLDFLPIISRGMKRSLGLFPYLSVPSTDLLSCSCNWTTVPASKLKQIKSKEELFAHGENIFITQNPVEIELFERFYPRVMREFIFDQGILLEVQTYMNQIKTEFRLRMGFNHGTKITIVGVHNRRTDYASYLKFKVQGRLLSTRYFENAMETFIQAHGDTTLFIMVSDDPKWLEKYFSDRQDVFFSFKYWPHCRNKVSFDMAVLANANHSIFSFGTFGFWGSYLTGGEAIMAKNFSAKPQGLLKYAMNYMHRWTYMQDPCLINGHVPKECSKNASLLGLS